MNIIMNAADSGGEMKEMLKYGSEVGKNEISSSDENICRLKFNEHEC